MGAVYARGLRFRRIFGSKHGVRNRSGRRADGFGANSPQVKAIAMTLANNPNDNDFAHQAARQSVNTDWLGVAVHCAQNSPLCAPANGGGPDALPDEPGGCANFNALFGSINVAPAICQGASTAACDSNGNVKDINGTVIADAFGRPGFPNIFSPTAAQSLGYAAAMLEKGIPIVYLYIADAHDRNPLPVDPVTGRAANAHAFGPGEAEYVAQLKAYDNAFGKFFARLAANGITKDNTLFVVVARRERSLRRQEANSVGCDGVETPCSYTFASEINASLNRLLRTQRTNLLSITTMRETCTSSAISSVPAAVTRRWSRIDHRQPDQGTIELSFCSARSADELLHVVTASPGAHDDVIMFGDDNYFFSNDTSVRMETCPAARGLLDLVLVVARRHVRRERWRRAGGHHARGRRWRGWRASLDGMMTCLDHRCSSHDDVAARSGQDIYDGYA